MQKCDKSIAFCLLALLFLSALSDSLSASSPHFSLGTCFVNRDSK